MTRRTIIHVVMGVLEGLALAAGFIIACLVLGTAVAFIIICIAGG